MFKGVLVAKIMKWDWELQTILLQGTFTCDSMNKEV